MSSFHLMEVKKFCKSVCSVCDEHFIRGDTRVKLEANFVPEIISKIGKGHTTNSYGYSWFNAWLDVHLDCLLYLIAKEYPRINDAKFIEKMKELDMKVLVKAI